MRNPRNKFGARRTADVNGVYKASSAEALRSSHLDLMFKAGKISKPVAQPKVQLTKYHDYRPDFTYMENQKGTTAPIRIFEDVKGAEGDRFKINVKLWREKGPGILRITKKHPSGLFIVTDEIVPDTIDPLMWAALVVKTKKPRVNIVKKV